MIKLITRMEAETVLEAIGVAQFELSEAEEEGAWYLTTDAREQLDNAYEIMQAIIEGGEEYEYYGEND